MRLSKLFAALVLALSAGGILTPALTYVASAHTPIRTVSTARIEVSNNLRLGHILTNGRGMTLYYSKDDRPGRSVCYGSCVKVWKPVTTAGRIIGPRLAGHFGSIMRRDGTHQVTYNGWPLYTFAFDRRPGSIAGQGSEGEWFVVTPALKRYSAPAHQVPAPAPPSSTNCIPQGGGDLDGDNSGSPSDGDGCT